MDYDTWKTGGGVVGHCDCCGATIHESDGSDACDCYECEYCSELVAEGDFCECELGQKDAEINELLLIIQKLKEQLK